MLQASPSRELKLLERIKRSKPAPFISGAERQDRRDYRWLLKQKCHLITHTWKRPFSKQCMKRLERSRCKGTQRLCSRVFLGGLFCLLVGGPGELSCPGGSALPAHGTPEFSSTGISEVCSAQESVEALPPAPLFWKDFLGLFKMTPSFLIRINGELLIHPPTAIS